MQRAARPLAATLAIVLVLGACGNGGDKDSKADVKADISEQLVEQGLSADEADCTADVIIDEVGRDEINDVDFNLEEPPADLVDEVAAASVKAVDECR